MMWFLSWTLMNYRSRFLPNNMMFFLFVFFFFFLKKHRKFAMLPREVNEYTI